MNSEYNASEVIEIGKAQDVILGGKDFEGPDDVGTRMLAVEDFDE